MDLREAGAVDPRRHWYYRSKARPLRRFAAEGPPPSLILDVGAGSGYFSDALAETLAPRPPVLQVDAAYPADEAPRPGLRRARALPERVPSGALVLLMDVLEHVDDDAAFLGDVARRCERPCRFFLTAPAFQSLWSPHDVFLGHKRRYALTDLERLAAGAGLAVLRGYYYFGLALPAAWLKRHLAPASGSELARLPGVLDAALAAACAAELPLSRANRLGGLTCVVEARRA